MRAEQARKKVEKNKGKVAGGKAVIGSQQPVVGSDPGSKPGVIRLSVAGWVFRGRWRG
jgi:hypothetical protein